MLSNYEKAVELIMLNKDLVNLDFYHCSEEIISRIKSLLNTQLPTNYIKFLKEIGYLSFGGEVVFGIHREELTKSSMLNWTLDERNNCGMPKNLIIIHELGYGTRDCLQINENDPDKSPVVEYHDPDSPVRVLAPDFGTFLLDLVQEEIKYQEEEKQKEVAKAPQEKMIQDELF